MGEDGKNVGKIYDIILRVWNVKEDRDEKTAEF